MQKTITSASASGGVMLHVHHIIFRSQGGTKAMGNLATVCNNCHKPKNHKPGEKPYGWRPVLPTFKSATFMTSVRWILYRRVKDQYTDTEVQMIYGAATKRPRRELDQKKRSGQELACDRTNRDHTWDTENLHRYRGTKVSAGTGIRSSHMIWSPIKDN